MKRTSASTLNVTRPARGGASLLALWPLAASLLLALPILRIGIAPIAAVAGVVAVSLLAHRFRRIAVAALVLSFLIPSLLQMIQLLPDGWDIIGGGVRISDVILVGMWGASFALMVQRREVTQAQRTLVAVSLVLAAVLLVAVVRNWPAYGLSALGEFRFRYLILGLPVYLALGADSAVFRLWTARWVAWAPVIGTMLALPMVASAKGWSLGEASRFYPSSISLALLLAAIWVTLRSADLERGFPQAASYGVLAFIVVLIVKDAHRSVWLVALACLIVLLGTRVVEVKRFWLWAVGLVLSALIGLVLMG
ncbi:hypothetical protein EG829_26225, partial [bacterium]|nr:hypothetical protein [bacterium]